MFLELLSTQYQKISEPGYTNLLLSANQDGSQMGYMDKCRHLWWAELSQLLSTKQLLAQSPQPQWDRGENWNKEVGNLTGQGKDSLISKEKRGRKKRSNSTTNKQVT